MTQRTLMGPTVAAAVVGCAMCLVSGFVPDARASSPTASGRMEALSLCQEAIRHTANNPSAAHVPYTQDYGSANEHYFAWPKGSGLTMMNAYGANLDVSASCTTTGDGKRITSLSVAGKTIL